MYQAVLFSPVSILYTALQKLIKCCEFCRVNGNDYFYLLVSLRSTVAQQVVVCVGGGLRELQKINHCDLGR